MKLTPFYPYDFRVKEKTYLNPRKILGKYRFGNYHLKINYFSKKILNIKKSEYISHVLINEEQIIHKFIEDEEWYNKKKDDGVYISEFLICNTLKISNKNIKNFKLNNQEVIDYLCTSLDNFTKHKFVFMMKYYNFNISIIKEVCFLFNEYTYLKNKQKNCNLNLCNKDKN